MVINSALTKMPSPMQSIIRATRCSVLWSWHNSYTDPRNMTMSSIRSCNGSLTSFLLISKMAALQILLPLETPHQINCDN